MTVLNCSKWKLGKKKKEIDLEKLKKGPFSRSEQKLVDTALRKVLEQEGLSFDHLGPRKILSMSRNKLPKNFWGRVTEYIPARSVESVYDHTRRRLSSQNYKGKWSPEDTFRLKELVLMHGKQWTKIGFFLNRLPGACYDKWRDALKIGEKRKKGRWTQEERCKLLQLVTIQKGHEMIRTFQNDKLIKWTDIAEKIGTRSYLQCRNEWTRFFSPGSKAQITLSDTIFFIDKIVSLNVSDESEIKWGSLLKGVPAHKIYNKWRSLCKKHFDSKNMNTNAIYSFKDFVSFIKENLPVMSKKKDFKKI